MDKMQLVKRHVSGRVYIPIFCTFEETGARSKAAQMRRSEPKARVAKGIRAKAAGTIMETEQARRIGADVTARSRAAAVDSTRGRHRTTAPLPLRKENRPRAQTQGRFQMQDCLSRFTRQQLPLPVQLLQQEQLLQQQPARQP